MLIRWAEPASDVPALIDSTGASLDYAALRAAVSRGAAQLGAAVRARPVTLAIASPVPFLIAALSVWEAGGVVVPMDLRAGAPALDALRRRAQPFLEITGATTAGELETRPGGFDRSLDERAALLLFTSGSSGVPKGVLLSREGIASNLDAILAYLPIREAPRTGVVLPLHYSYALVGQALTTLRAGGTLVMLGDVPFPAEQAALLARHRVDGLSSVPTSLRVLAKACSELPPDERPRLKYWASAGAPFDANTLSQVKVAFGPVGFNQYGLTEASPRVSAIRSDDEAIGRGAVGRPLAGIEVEVRDPSGVRCEPGVSGALFVRGPSVMLGYLDDPEGTRAVLSPDGWLRTGDVAHVDADGRLFVHGRADGVVKIAGERVSVEEIAATLRQVAGVTDAAAIAIDDPSMGARLVGFIEAPEELVSTATRKMRELLPPAKRPVRILPVDALPRTANGKVAFAALRALLENA